MNQDELKSVGTKTVAAPAVPRGDVRALLALALDEGISNREAGLAQALFAPAWTEHP
jgi:hypothetical protein